VNHRERQNRIYRNGGGVATSNARSVQGEAGSSEGARRATGEVQLDSEEVHRLKSVVAADVATTKTCWRSKVRPAEARGPLGWWRFKR
jgi:hypothetical protein